MGIFIESGNERLGLFSLPKSLQFWAPGVYFLTCLPMTQKDPKESAELLENNPPERYQDNGKLNTNRPSDNLEKDGSGQRLWKQDKQNYEEKSLAQRRSGNRNH